MAPRVHLVNPSHVSFGVAVITPRWLYVLAAATGTNGAIRSSWTRRWSASIRPPSATETSSASASTPAMPGAATKSGKLARERGAWVVYGGIHATLFPDEAHEHGAAHAVVKGDGDLVWPAVVRDCLAGTPQPRLRRRTGRRRRVPSGALGPAARGPLHVGIGADGARLSEALLVLLGVAHRRAGAAAARRRTASSARSSSCGAADSGSSRSPTTISIRSRSRTSRWRAGGQTRRACTSWRRCARSDSS